MPFLREALQGNGVRALRPPLRGCGNWSQFGAASRCGSARLPGRTQERIATSRAFGEDHADR
jgi:hypothetical protein